MQFPVHGRLLSLFAALLLSAGFSVQAATLTVTNLNDDGDGSLRQSVASAASGDTVVFAPGLTGTITLTGGQMNIDKTLTIVGPGADLLTLNGYGDRHLSITSAGSLTASGLTFSHGVVSGQGVGAGSISNAGRLELRQCHLYDNQVNGSVSGYAGCLFNSGTLVVVDCHFLNNTLSVRPYGGSSSVSTARGGAVYTVVGSATFTGTTFESNSAQASAADYPYAEGGAIFQSGP